MEKENKEFEEIENFIDLNYEIFQQGTEQEKEEIIFNYLSKIDQKLEFTKKLQTKGYLLYLKASLLMMYNKDEPQLEKEILKSVKIKS